jgi:hypothetical protein
VGGFGRPPFPQGVMMKIKILEKCYTGDRGNMFAGEEHEVNDTIAGKLIARGLAEEVTEKKSGRSKKKLEDRSFDVAEIETPEDE